MPVEIKRADETMGMSNKMSLASAYALLNLLAQLQGRTFSEWSMGRNISKPGQEATIINPALFACFNDQPLAIRCDDLYLDGVPEESVMKMVKPEQLILWKMDVTAMREEEMRSLFEFIASSGKWCSSLTLHRLHAQEGFIEELISVCSQVVLHDYPSCF